MQEKVTKKIRVLIADDNREYVDVLCSYMKQESLIEIVGCAYDGIEAVNLMRMTDPDILILDMVMPNLDGIGVLERMRNLHLKKEPKILVVSAVLSDSLAAKTISLGAQYFMLKPVDFNVLINRIVMFAKEDEQNVKELLPRDKGSNSNSTDIETMVTKIIHEIGIPAHIKGYQYLRHAIMMVINNLDM